jgi:hypothetical protein
MPLSIPLRSDLPSFRFQVELDGASYSFDFAWNWRDEGWYFTLADANGDAIASGSRLVVNSPLARTSDTRRPPGVLLAVDTTGQHADPGYADLGKRCLLLYVPEAEVAAL